MEKMALRSIFVGLLLALPMTARSCTNVIVTPDASADGSAMLAYNADSGSTMGLLYHYPATEGRGREMREVFSWDNGSYLGQIAEANRTYNVVGNCNEHGLCIGESTFGGVKILSSQKGGIIDYGSLEYITLQRSQTAREAIRTMESLVDTYGYASEGESFSILDRSGEAWLMELIGRGNSYGKKGAVWVALRVPDGMVSAHANQARIRTFPRDDPDNCMYSKDVVDVAVHYGLYPAKSNPKDFSFSDAYCPVTYFGARNGDGRVWAAFSALAGPAFEREYADYVRGHNLDHRMPLWIKPEKKVTLKDLTQIMASHFEGTILDPTVDIGAGIFDTPYRPRPVAWAYGEDTFISERTIAAAQTDWNFIAQIRQGMPRELSTLLWFGVDDSSTSPRVPVYACSNAHSHAYVGRGPQDGVTSPLLKLDMSKAFWVMNMVSNLVYGRWSAMYPIVRAHIDRLQHDFEQEVKSIDEFAISLYKSEGIEAALNFVTKYGIEAGDGLHEEWLEFYGTLFVSFRDFFEIVPDHKHAGCGCQVKEVGISDKWKQRIVRSTGGHYEVRDFPSVLGGLPSDELVELTEVQAERQTLLRSTNTSP